MANSNNQQPPPYRPYRLLKTLTGHQRAVACVKFSNNGKLFASSSLDKTLIIWSTETLSKISTLVGHSEGVNDLAWSSDSHYICSASDDKTLRIWDAFTSECVKTLRGHTNFVFCVNFSPQSNLIVSGSFDETIRVWDVKNGRPVHVIQAHSMPVTSVHFNRDGSLIVSGSHDGSCKIWDAASGACLKTLIDDKVPAVSFAKFSPNERFILVATTRSIQAHSRSVGTRRSISQITVNFFKTLDMHAYNLNQLVEEAQTVNDQKLSELEKKFEECPANEERRLLEKVAELLASSNSRKNKLVKAAVIDLWESDASRTGRLQQEMSTMQDSTSYVKVKWSSYIDKAEAHYLEDSAAVESGKKDLEGVLQNCLQKAKMRQQSSAQESLLSLEKSNAASVDEIIRGGMDANQILRSRFSFAVSSTLEDADITSKNLLCSIDHSLQLDHDACGNLDSMIIPCCGDLRELKNGHYHKTGDPN